ncbi:expansin-like B1 [Senna tora]|uniref:Expansin-like B1 n=1 Tax=Senna tora TaxID=362788 RepID=A0A834U2C5_9FABA|nr:expansin-like B1 [Senna tora]
MEFHSKHLVGLLCVMVLLPLLCTSQDFTSSRATYYGSPDCYGNPRGACGFGEYGRTVNDGSVAGVSALWKNGSGCGGCYQVRCKNPQYCDEYGSYVVVTDYGEGDRTDFVMSPRAYSRLGRNPDASAELFKYGVVDVEYRRVPCRYAGYNVLLKVHEHSKYPDYLAVVILYVGGRYDVASVEMWVEDCKQWTPLRRAFGAVFDVANPPRGQINVRFLVSSGAGTYWVQPKNAIPSDWEAGVAYDSEVQLD